jgi:flagellar hook-associated protein 2
MTSGTGSISVTGLLGGTAGQIDVNSLISSLMQAAAVPQTQLQDQLQTQTTQITTYQTINSKLSALLTAGQALTTGTTWTATSATSSSSSVVATSTAGAPMGTSTFSVKSVAQAQVSIVTADSSGNVVSDPTQGITINGTNIALTSGSASDVAAAINSAGVGVSANVVNADGGKTILQLTSTKTGTAGAFTTGNGDGTGDFESGALSTLVAAQDAQIQVGSDSAGYTVTSSTNSFTNVIPGVTFSVSAPADSVTITVGNNEQAVSNAVSALVTAANAATTEMDNDTAQGAVLATNTSVESISQSILSAVSRGTSSGGSLSTYGISIDSNGVMSFDATAFASAYNADPTGTQKAINDFATSLNNTTSSATDPTYGSITTAITSGSSIAANLTSEIGTWNDRLTQIKSAYTTKFTAMETALAGLQSQQTYLTSMFNSINNSSSNNSSS